MCKTECVNRVAKSEKEYLYALEGGLASNLRCPKITSKSLSVGVAIAWVCAAVAIEYVCISVGSNVGSRLTQL
jgi:hypothetical protein